MWPTDPVGIANAARWECCHWTRCHPTRGCVSRIRRAPVTSTASVPWKKALPKANFSTLIVGKNHQGREIVYTVHPGAPVLLPHIGATPDLIGKTVTVAEAQKMGFTMAKAAPVESQ